MRDLIATTTGPTWADTTLDRHDFVEFGSGATLFGALPDGTPSSAILLRLSVPAPGSGNDRPARRVMGWARLSWQPATPRA